MLEKLKSLPFTNNLLKIIAIISMTLDHIGYAILEFVQNTNLVQMARIFRYIGRLAMPIYAFLIVEGLMHTKDKLNNLIKMSILALFMAISFALIQSFTNYIILDNIFISFVLVIGTVILLENKNIPVKILAVLPFLYVIFNFVIEVLELKNGGFIGYYDSILPTYLRGQYNLMLYLLVLIPYFLINNYKKREIEKCKEANIIEEDYLSSVAFKVRYNGIFCISLAIIDFIFWIITYINKSFDILSMSYQSYMILAIVPIILYNHELRYKNKILSWAFYLYYPIHLGIIFGVMALLYL